MATRVLPPRAVKKRPLESSSDVEVVPKPTRTPAKKKTAAKKGTEIRTWGREEWSARICFIAGGGSMP